MNHPTLSIFAGRQRLEQLCADPTYPHTGRLADQLKSDPIARAAQGSVLEVRNQLDAFETDDQFDSALAVELHKRLKVTSLVAEDAGFWRWVAIELGPDLVEFRHGRKGRAAQGNFGLGPRWHSLFMRLWFRAELSFDEDSGDPYWLTVRGGSDFWASGIIRHRYSSSRNLSKALVKFAYPDASKPTRGIWRMRSRNDPEGSGFQQLWKRLTHLHATVVYETLSVEQCTEIIEQLSKDLPRDYS